MLRTIAAIPLLGAALFLTATEADAHRRVIVPQRIVQVDLAGSYENITSGGSCSIYRSGRGWVFINEHGASAYFEQVTPRQLEMVSGEWDPTTATIMRHRNGQLMLRFDSGSRPGYWLKVGW